MRKLPPFKKQFPFKQSNRPNGTVSVERKRKEAKTGWRYVISISPSRVEHTDAESLIKAIQTAAAVARHEENSLIP